VGDHRRSRRGATATGRWNGEVALLQLLGRPGVATLLVGARTTEQLEQSFAAARGLLPAESAMRLTEASAPGLRPYPYGMIEPSRSETIWGEQGTARRET